jgi:osmotically-inducible protein OsmY
MRSIVLVLAMVLVAVTLAPAAGHADDRLLGQVLTDLAVTVLVKVRLVGARAGNLAGIHVDTHHGVVRLRGTVPTEADWAEADRLARGTSGVERVVNDLRIGPRAS